MRSSCRHPLLEEVPHLQGDVEAREFEELLQRRLPVGLHQALEWEYQAMVPVHPSHRIPTAQRPTVPPLECPQGMRGTPLLAKHGRHGVASVSHHEDDLRLRQQFDDAMRVLRILGSCVDPGLGGIALHGRRQQIVHECPTRVQRSAIEIAFELAQRLLEMQCLNAAMQAPQHSVWSGSHPPGAAHVGAEIREPGTAIANECLAGVL